MTFRTSERQGILYRSCPKTTPILRQFSGIGGSSYQILCVCWKWATTNCGLYPSRLYLGTVNLCGRVLGYSLCKLTIATFSKSRRYALAFLHPLESHPATAARA